MNASELHRSPYTVIAISDYLKAHEDEVFAHRVVINNKALMLAHNKTLGIMTINNEPYSTEFIFRIAKKLTYSFYVGEVPNIDNV